MKKRRAKQELIRASQRLALLWLRNRGGEGVFNKDDVLIARGELAPVARPTWRKLQSAGLIGSRAPHCVHLTRQGKNFDLHGVEESQAAGFVQDALDF